MKLKLRLIFWRLWPNVKAAGRGIPERRLVFCSLETAALAFNSADTFSLVMNIKERTVFAATMPQENGSHCKSILSQHEGCSSWVRRVIVRSFSESSYSSEVLKTSEKNVFFQRRGVCWILSVSPKTAEDMQHNEAKSLLPARTPATMSLEGRPRQASHQSGWLAIWKRP